MQIAYLLHITGQVDQVSLDVLMEQGLWCVPPAHDHGNHDHDYDLAGIGFGGCYANLTASIDMDPAVCLPGNCTCHNVGNPHTECTTLLGNPQCLDRQEITPKPAKSVNPQGNDLKWLGDELKYCR